MKRPAPVRSLFAIPLVVIVLFVAACVLSTPQPGAFRNRRFAVIGVAPSRIAFGTLSTVDMTTRTAGASPTVATWQ